MSIMDDWCKRVSKTIGKTMVNTMINPMRSSPMRMMGLASGMDTDSIIQQTLRLHQFKIDNQMRDRRVIEWRQQTHNTIRNEISSLRTTFLSSLGSKSMMSRNTFNATTATITGNSNNAVSIRTNAGSPLGNFSIDAVTQLAKGAHLSTAQGASASGNGFPATARLGDMNFAGGKMYLSADGEATLTFNTGGDDVTVDVKATDTLSDVMAKINNSGAGVIMSYDRLTDQFSLEVRTGANADPLQTTLTVDDGGSGFFNLIRGNVSSNEPAIREGQQAIAWINDEEVRSNSNSFDFRGVGITLNSTFNVDDKGNAVDGVSVGVSLRRDSNQVFDRVKEFIDSYNMIIKRLEGLLSERKSSNEVGYKPLTDEEKSGMTDRQIEEWEAIARKGLLRGDNGIQNLVSNLRRSFFEEIEEMGISPSSIGLSTGSYFDGNGGQIMINEERLRAAIERDPDMVADVFVRIDTTGGQPRGVGLLHKIDGLMRDYVNTTQTTTTRGLEDSLKSVNEQIERLQTRMFAEEDRLYRVFAQMEKAMQQLQQQGGWFNAMLGQ